MYKSLIKISYCFYHLLEVEEMKSKKSKVVRGKFRLGENAFPSARQRREDIMADVDRVVKKSTELKKKAYK